MARWWRGRSRDDEGPTGPEPAPGPGRAAESAPGGGPAWVVTLGDGEGNEQEIARVGIPPEQYYGMRADAALDRLGPDHPETLTAFRDYARVLARTPEHRAEACERMAEVARAQWRVLGPDHPETLVTSADLADLLQATGELNRAEGAWRSVWNARAERLGRDHGDTLAAAVRLAEVLEALHRVPEGTAVRRASWNAAGSPWAPATPTPSAPPTATPCP
ncbi:PE-PGRS family protein [Streptomyces sp. e14]|uniref:tetratricopeptide repeat protein n=1 Tax=Streptomyces sp. e14 TaxID=645465 RepID=UPI0001D06E55|nr:tetratricopeptide repeat protein [Streptomyces sp. e14]EFF93101.1 PE-PGRS family protein [Streptomyces sp. e14]